MPLHGGATVGSVLVLDRFVPRVTLSCHCRRIDKDKDVQKRHDKREYNDINRLDKLGNTSRHCHRRVADVIGGP